MPLSDDLSLLPDNSNQEITPADVRAAFTSIHTSLDDDEDFAGTTAAALAGKIAASLYDANTILKADTDNTPEALTVAEQRIVGRITGGEITALTTTQVYTMLGTSPVPDNAFTDFDLTGDLADLFGGTINLGTNGAVTMRYRRVGRMVEGWLWIGATDTATYGSGGPLYIPGSALPVAPQLPNTNPSGSSSGWVSPGGYGFFNSVEAGFQFGASPTIANIGSAAMVFAKTDANTSGLDGIVSDSSPTNLKLDFWSYSGYFAYEADNAA